MDTNRIVQFESQSKFTYDEWDGGKIIACFARSFDNNREEFTKNIHLISSVVSLNLEKEFVRKHWRINRINDLRNGRIEYDKYSDFDEIVSYINKNSFLVDLQNYTTSVNSKDIRINDDYYEEVRFIFHVFKCSDIEVAYNEYVKHNGEGTRTFNEGQYIMRYDGCLVSIFINIDVLLDNYRYNLSHTSKLFKNIFGFKIDQIKNMDNIWTNSLFVFYNIYWYNVLLRFKYHGIDISGGSISKRHVLTTCDYKLSRNLYDIYGSDQKLNQLIHSNLKDDFISSTIPDQLYKEFLSNKNSEYSAQLNRIVINRLKSKGKYDGSEKNSNLDVDTTIPNYKEGNYLDYKGKQVTYNYILGLEILYQSIFYSYKKIIKELKKSHSDDEAYLLRDGSTTISMQNVLINQLDRIKEIEKEFSNFKENIEKMNICDLFQLNEKLNQKRFGSKPKINKLKKNINKKKYQKDRILGFRGYSTLSTPENKCESLSVAVAVAEAEAEAEADETRNGIVDNDIENLELRKEFLVNSSRFGIEIFNIVKKAKGDPCEETYIKIQKEIEEHCIKFESESIEKLISQAEKSNKYDPVIMKLMLEWNNKIILAIDNFIHEYEINNFKKLVTEMKKNSGKSELFLLIFAIKYKVREQNLKRKEVVENSIYTDFKLKQKEILIYRQYIKYYKSETSTLVTTIISLIVNMISGYYVKGSESLWGEISQANLILILGDEFVKRAPKKLPELFLNSDPNWKDSDKNYIREFYIQNLIVNVSLETKYTIGNSILDLILETVDIFEVSGPIFSKGKYNKFIKIRKEYFDFLNHELAHTKRLPMVVKPLDWNYKDLENKGGFISNEYKNIINSNLIHYNYRNSGKNIISEVQTNTINYLNNQLFKINKDVLTFLLKEFRKEDSFIFKGLNKIHPKTSEWKVLDLEEKKYVSSHNSKYNLYRNILALAIIFEDVNFYIPTYYDFRGRIYSSADYLTYQGEDIARSLIEFSKGCKLDKGSIVYVLQQLANTSGRSKLSVSNKNNWAINIINKLGIPLGQGYARSYRLKKRKNLNIKKLGLIIREKLNLCDFKFEDLLSNKYLIELMYKNDDKLQFLTTLHSLIKYFLNPNLMWKTPICFDATCSGFQHLSAIFSDTEMAIYSNVTGYIPTNKLHRSIVRGNSLKFKFRFKKLEQKLRQEQEPWDIYQKVANTVVKSINNLHNENEKEWEKETEKEKKKEKEKEKDILLQSKLIKLNITRKLLKRPVMTIPYNVGLITMGEQLLSEGFFIKKYDSFSKYSDSDSDSDSEEKSYFYIVSPELLKDEYKGETIVLTSYEMQKFNTILYFSVYDTFPNLRDYVNYLNKFAYIFANLDSPIVWTTPVGMTIQMAYNEFKRKRGKNLFNPKKSNSVSLPLKKMDKLANKIAFMPNFIHSMDSTNIQLLIKNLLEKKQFINLFTIHDCFATTPDNMKLLNYEVRKAFAMMYFDMNYIKNLHIDFLKQISLITQIYQMDTEGNRFPADIENNITLPQNLFVIINNNGKEVIKNIPDFPFEEKWEVVKDIFKEGILSSIYFIC
uniref:DNA-directed RNA polymerase n=1 Tax=Termitomyces sp. DKA64 TaxID=2811476 RepID=A0A8F1AD80_9AGAR|nr:RNA polymerase [Termitomyces sp. DKA64]